MTVLDVSNNRVTQVKTESIDGYSAIQVAFGSRKASRVTKPEAGQLRDLPKVAQRLPRTDECRVGKEDVSEGR